jgi:hypothetical protein
MSARGQNPTLLHRTQYRDRQSRCLPRFILMRASLFVCVGPHGKIGKRAALKSETPNFFERYRIYKSGALPTELSRALSAINTGCARFVNPPMIA